MCECIEGMVMQGAPPMVCKGVEVVGKMKEQQLLSLSSEVSK